MIFTNFTKMRNIYFQKIIFHYYYITEKTKYQENISLTCLTLKQKFY